MIGYTQMRNILQTNWYVDDFIRKMIGRTYNREMQQFVSELGNIKSVFAVDEFVEKMKGVPAGLYGTSYTFKRAFSENTLYGYAEQIMAYAGIPAGQMFYFPLLEHGISYGQRYDRERYNIRHSYIFQGRYKAQGWKRIKNHKKAYYIGPYIHYADPIYSKTEEDEIKKKLGKTVLLFLPHSTEYANVNFDMECILEKYLKRSGDSVDTVMVCVFWKDLTKELIKSVDRARFKLVTAGFKLDPLFVKRLKSILQLSDKIIYTSLSSSIGYSFYLKKDIIVDIPEEVTGKTSYITRYEKELMKYFSMETQCSYEHQYRYIDRYWGLSEIRKPAYIRKIYEQNRYDIIRQLGF